MYMTSTTPRTSVLPYWNEIKKLSREDRSNLAELIESSLKEDELNNEDPFIDQLSPDLMKGLAEYAVQEHRAGRCISQEQVESSIMEAMGWN